ncbi:sensor histidine kinase [Thermosediminibacter litoriperuensis]|uniref:Oxygen sensor histidine kinase NreB n=1 Tax=Thermosediminibacter litoriperuensis TaxID=291989 RepID=A0A5S5AR43_9FIRM|nr:sensor histidine kinase [Thermosediminibacter litoriperuensis]TYP53778.1 two-component system sensor histidine kinase DegS [Thermosediminibacter litoriperuensis]
MVNVSNLERIINKTKKIVEKSREELYRLGETARQEYERTRYELDSVKNQISDLIREVDELEGEYTKARLYLMEVSRDFNRHSEEQIKGAYEAAHAKQLELLSKREKEKLLRLTRDHLERNLKNLETTIRRSEELIANVSMVLKILGRDLESLSVEIGEMQQRQALGFSIIMAQEEERKRVAREIHDGPAQSLANIVMRAEYCLKLMDISPSKVKEELFGLMDLVRSSLQDVRKIIFDLRPMSLDDLGLVPALKKYVEQYRNDCGIYVELTVLGREYPLDGCQAVAIFRVIHEAMTNIKKYAGASQAVIKVEFSKNRVNVVVRDNGIGFDVERVLSEKRGVAFGIVGMRERIQLLKGKFEIKSAPGHGTEIAFSVPVVNNEKLSIGSRRD